MVLVLPFFLLGCVEDLDVTPPGMETEPPMDAEPMPWVRSHHRDHILRELGVAVTWVQKAETHLANYETTFVATNLTDEQLQELQGFLGFARNSLKFLLVQWDHISNQLPMSGVASMDQIKFVMNAPDDDDNTPDGSDFGGKSLNTDRPGGGWTMFYNYRWTVYFMNLVVQDHNDSPTSELRAAVDAVLRSWIAADLAFWHVDDAIIHEKYGDPGGNVFCPCEEPAAP